MSHAIEDVHPVFVEGTEQAAHARRKARNEKAKEIGLTFQSWRP